MKRFVIKVLVLVLILLLAAGGLYWYFNDGVSHRDICGCVKDEAASIRAQVDTRADRVEAKLDRIEAKLDKILKIAEQPPLDGMRRVE